MHLSKIISAYLVHNQATGYNIAKFLAPLTKQSHQQIYRELNKMVEKNIVTYVDVEQVGKPDKKVYRLLTPNKTLRSLKKSVAQQRDIKTKYYQNSVAYNLLINDILFDKDLFNKYVAHMEKAEKAFIDSLFK